MSSKTEQKSVDESLYSRQIYAIGKEAMNKITQGSVCISGMSGLGIELAKCVILAGVNTVTLHTPKNILTYRDLASNYYADENMIGKEYLEKITSELGALNNNVNVTSTRYLTQRIVLTHTVMVFCDYNIHELLFWNRFCRDNDIKFIAVQTYGLMGNLFCDFGKNHIVNDLDGNPISSGKVKEIKDNKIITYEPHMLCTGDVIAFTANDTFESDTKYAVKIITSNEFELHQYLDIDPDELRIHAFRSKCIQLINKCDTMIQYNQVKIPTKINFKSLEESLNDPEYVMFDTIRFDIPQILNAFMIALSMWRLQNAKNKTSDYPVSKDHRDQLYTIFHLELEHSKKNAGFKITDDVCKIFDLLVLTSGGLVPGVDAIIGSIGAQEVLKAVSDKFTPNKQFLHFEALNILPDDYQQQRLTNPDNFKPMKSRYDGQIVIFGREYVKKMHEKNIFIVGSGAIGCEHIKNFCMMGLGLADDKDRDTKSGSIVLTDMDHIENSNLNRQFLFRRSDIGQSKSLTAAKKAKEMNPRINITAHCNKVGEETVNVYNNKFYDKIDFVVNALDNVEARKYVDQRCVRYNKPLFESGTLGTKGNVQSIIPHLTESYGSSQDPPEQSIPVCTLKLFPYKYEHVVQRSKDQFEGYFNRVPSNIIKFMRNPEELLKLNPDDLEIVAEDVKLVGLHCKNFKFCINLGFLEWHKLFRDNINQLIKKYPRNHIDEDGNPFWTGNKPFPKSFSFNHENDLDLDFVISFSNIWADMLGIKNRYKTTERQKYIDFLKGLKIPSETICKDIDNNNGPKNEKKTMTHSGRIDEITELIQEFKNKGYFDNIRVIEFEKDDDTNHHIDFITAASNIRAANYSIKGSDRLETKGIAGKIIPALATTTSIVSGLVSLEIYKVLYGFLLGNQYNTLERYRFGSFNLATQSFGFGESLPAIKIKIGTKEYDLWTKHELTPDLSIEDLLENYHDEYTKKIGDVSVDVGIDLDSIASDKGVICRDTTAIDTRLTLRELIKSTLGDDEPIEEDYYLTLCLEEYEYQEGENDSSEEISSSHLINCKVRL